MHVSLDPRRNVSELGMAQQQMRSWMTAMPGETLSSFGIAVSRPGWSETALEAALRGRRTPSLGGTDAWHYGKGYVHSPRQADLFLWGRETGPVGYHTYHYWGEVEKVPA